MLTLFKSIVLPILECACQLWNPKSLQLVKKLKTVQRLFTKHITGMFDLSYKAILCQLNLYSLQRKRDQYQILNNWKIIQSKVTNLEPPIQTTSSSRLGRFCVNKTVPSGHAGTLMYNSFRWNAIRFFNALPASISSISNYICERILLITQPEPEHLRSRYFSVQKKSGLFSVFSKGCTL